MRGSAELRLLLSLRRLPRGVALFYLRARRLARRTGDRFSLDSAARPAELADLLELSMERRTVVELGTGTAWSTLALAIEDRERSVISYDPTVRGEREGYLGLVSADVRARIELRAEPDTAGPHPGDAPVDFLFIDSLHEREPAAAAFRAWRAALAPGAVVVFHDYGHPAYPGVAEAVSDLGLDGRRSGGQFVWRAPG
ncbi:MAG: class I SAM-dependent methyltransferase [Solirubrobacteraceae bacterium]